MSEIVPELYSVSDPSVPRWVPPTGNRITIDQPDAAVVEDERG